LIGEPDELLFHADARGDTAGVPESIASRRVRAQLSMSHATPHAVVAHFGAMQAQDYLGALWAVGARMGTALETEVEEALAQRTIVRCWPMRGTLHFVAAKICAGCSTCSHRAF
jgi:hypothetical protein